MNHRPPAPPIPSGASPAFSGAAAALRTKIRACAARNFAAQRLPAEAVMAEYGKDRGHGRESLGGKTPQAGRC